MNTQLPALSIRQPWAASIVWAKKDVENRSWPTKFRGRFLIHAGKGMTNDEIVGWKEFISARKLDDARDAIGTVGEIETFRDLPRGGIVGEAEIVDCVSASDSPWFMGQFGFVLKNVKPLPFAPCRGMLGFFKPVFGAAQTPAPTRFKKGDHVRMRGEDSKGYVQKADAKMAYVEWTGFPPGVPTDNYYHNSQLVLAL